MAIQKLLRPKKKSPPPPLPSKPPIASSALSPTSSSSIANQQHREPIEVYARLRPLENYNLDNLAVKKIDDQTLEINLKPSSSSTTSSLDNLRFKFKHIFDHCCSQKEIFNKVAEPLVEDLIHGKNGLIFTYGATGSGKTYTIAGNPQDCGLLPRIIDMIFNTLERNQLQSVPFIFKPNSQNGFDLISPPDALQQLQKKLIDSNLDGHQSTNSLNKRQQFLKNNEISQWNQRIIDEEIFCKDINCDQTFSVFVSYIEIYNNYINDLLEDEPITTNSKKTIMEDSNKRSYIHNVKQIEVRSADETFELFCKGMNRRKTGSTQINMESSRSHSVFTIRIVQAPLDLEGVLPIENEKLIQIGQLSIVDLAGCERTTRTKASGNRLKEANNINNSLLTLRKCFDLLREKNQQSKPFVPYRDSKLTHLFKNYFDGDGKVKLIICINPDLESLDETIQVCKFAEKSKELLTTATTTNTTNNQRTINNFYHENVNYFKMQRLESNVCYTSLLSSFQLFPNADDENEDDNFNIIDNDDENDETFQKLHQYIDQKRNQYEKYESIHKQNQLDIRESIINMEQELIMLKDENKTLKKDLQYREKELINLKENFNKLKNQNLQKEDNIKKLLNEIAELKQKLSNERIFRKNEQLECERLRRNFGISSSNQQNNQSINDNQLKNEEKQQITTDSETSTLTTQPIVNPKFNKKIDNSTKWIDHRPMLTLKLGTIMQPKLNQKKSVTKLKTTDFIPSNRKNLPNKYSLTHHETTKNGLIETKIFKGDVIPSSVGGAQIIFKDIETLKQESP